MAHYRFYMMDGKGRIAGPPDVVECDDDTTALELCKQRLRDRDVEVWAGPKFLGRFNHLTRERDDPK